MTSVITNEATPIRSPEQLKAELEGKPETGEQKVSRLYDPRLEREYEFELKYVDGRGKAWPGKFKNQILNFVQVSQVGAIKAHSLGGAPAASCDEYTLDHAEKLSHLTVSLVERPDWAKGSKLEQLNDKGLLDALYAEVARHEGTFHGRIPAEEDGSGESANTEGSPA